MPEVCDVWWVNGAFFTGLTVGVEMTVRASAPGYLAGENCYADGKSRAADGYCDPGPESKLQ
jgi:hypothetical protein